MLSGLVGVVLLRPWVTPRAPMTYIGDELFHLMLVKTIAGGSWPYTEPLLGAPVGQQALEHSVGEGLQVAVLWVLTRLSGDAVLVTNVYYYLTFPLAAVAAYLVLRRLAISAPVATVLGFGYAFLPYHFMRGPSHLLLTAYFVVPLGVYLLVELTRPEVCADSPGVPAVRGRTRTICIAAAVVLVGTTHVYYALFTVMLLVVFALLRWLSDRDLRALATSAVAVAAILALAGIQLVPAILFAAEHGPRDAAHLDRTYWGVEAFAMKPVDLVLPVFQHRVPALAALTRRSITGVTPSELGQNLGLVGALGLVGLLVFSLRRLTSGSGVGTPRERTYSFLGSVVLVGILLATVAGFGAILGVLGFTQLRGWNRMSLFVAFCALAAVGVFLDALLARARRTQLVTLLVLAPLVVVMALDQMPFDSVGAPVGRADAAAAYYDDDEFFSAVESVLPDGAAVFQHPYVPFPGGGIVEGIGHEDQLKPFLHTDTLRWSGGQMAGRGDEWQRPLTGLPPADALDVVAGQGFDALLLDRHGFADRGAFVDAELRRLLGAPLLESPDGRYGLYDLGRLRTR